VRTREGPGLHQLEQRGEDVEVDDRLGEKGVDRLEVVDVDVGNDQLGVAEGALVAIVGEIGKKEPGSLEDVENSTP
jgi:hypothetical protein